MSEFEHAGARWLGPVVRPKLSPREKLTMARMEIDEALRKLEELKEAMRRA